MSTNVHTYSHVCESARLSYICGNSLIGVVFNILACNRVRIAVTGIRGLRVKILVAAVIL